MEKKYDSYCGLYCGACAILLSNEKGEIENDAKSWNMNVEDVRCFGCKSKINAIYCRDCEFKTCCESKKINFCFQCNEYPCSKLLDFKNDKYSHHSVVLKNLESIHQKGLVKWLKDQEKRWKCASCGTRFTWYDKLCEKCGEKLFNCEAEEKEL